MLEMSFHVITNSDIFYFSLFFQLYQCFPSLESDLCVFRVVDFEFADSGPMDEQKIKILTI